MKLAKKNLILLSIALMVLLSSCATTGVYDASEKEIVNDENLMVNVDGMIEKHTFMIYGFSLVSNKGVSLTIENISDSPVVINWEKSSISYGNNTSSVFLSGQKAITANTTAMPPLTLPSKKSTTVDIYPAKNVKFNSDKMEWEIGKMGLKKNEPLVLLLNYEYKSEEHFMNVEVAPKNGFIKLGF
jgi:hypothetical protein